MFRQKITLSLFLIISAIPVSGLIPKSATAPLPTEDTQLRILIVPGHEPDSGGAEFGQLKEREMNLVLGNYLKEYLDQDGRFETFITRDNSGWAEDFEDYFVNKRNEILEWSELAKADYLKLISEKKVIPTGSILNHNEADAESSIRLYGITKWANENKIDAVLHIHFNDMHRKNMKKPGLANGFSIYIPDKNFGNSQMSETLAQNIFENLAEKYQISDRPGEEAGIIYEPNLIALGSYNTSLVPSILIEYGYIYEKQFQNSQARDLVLRDLAFRTSIGVKKNIQPPPRQ